MNTSVIQSINWANVVLNDEVLATEVWQPMFFWYWQLINTYISFWPVIIFIWFFWLVFEYVKWLTNWKSLSSKKSLENK